MQLDFASVSTCAEDVRAGHGDVRPQHWRVQVRHLFVSARHLDVQAVRFRVSIEAGNVSAQLGNLPKPLICRVFEVGTPRRGVRCRSYRGSGFQPRSSFGAGLQTAPSRRPKVSTPKGTGRPAVVCVARSGDRPQPRSYAWHGRETSHNKNESLSPRSVAALTIGVS
jgi:hypothetical protein